MRRFRRARRMVMRAPITSYKHQFQEDVSYLGASANNQVILYVGGKPQDVESPGTVSAGHKVYSVDVSVNFTTLTSGDTSRYNWMLVHLRSDQFVNTLFASVDAANWSVIGLSTGRNQVIKSFVGLVGTEDAGPLKQNIHIPIPKQWHRVREGDQLVLVFNAFEPGSLVSGFRYKSFS